MTIKEMKNTMKTINNKVMSKGDRNKYRKYIELRHDLLKESGYTKKYDGRLYLQESAKKDQVELYYNCTMIAYDMMYC